MRHQGAFLWFAAALLAAPVCASAQDIAPLPQEWGNAGLGIGSSTFVDDNPLLAMGLSLTGRYRLLGVTARYTYLFDTPGYGKSAKDYAILVGPVFRLGTAVVHPTVGVSWVTARAEHLGSDSEVGPEAGTALGLLVFPSTVPRLALHGFASLNRSLDTAGAMLVFQLAK